MWSENAASQASGKAVYSGQIGWGALITAVAVIVLTLFSAVMGRKGRAQVPRPGRPGRRSMTAAAATKLELLTAFGVAFSVAVGLVGVAALRRRA